MEFSFHAEFYSMIAHSALRCGDILIVFFVGVQLRRSELDLELME